MNTPSASTTLDSQTSAVFRRTHIAFLLPVLAASLLIGHSLFHATAAEELVLVGLAVAVLVTGHALIRAHASRLAAEREADRARAELDLTTRVGDCEQRRQSLSAFAQMAAHVAHEVRNPLSSILLNAELLEDEAARCNCDNSGEARILIGSIRREAERLQHLTDEYLAFSRPPIPSPVHHNLNAIVDDIVHLVRAQAGRQHVDIVTDMSRECPCAVMDPQQIKQAALNLVRNALEAMPDGGRLTMATRVEHDGSLSLSVADRGPGISEEQRCQLFEPFYTTKQSGSGLGLSLVAHIVRDHGGDVEVQNEAHGGARFTMRLPASRAELGACACSGGVAQSVPEGPVVL